MEEAKKRGLLNLRTMPEAMPYYISDKNVKLFTKNKIFTETEIHSRYEIQLENALTDNEKAKDALKAKGFTVGRTNVVAAEVGDRPGGLHTILEMLNAGGVNVEYMYAFVTQSGRNAILIWSPEPRSAPDASLRSAVRRCYQPIP